MALDLHKGDPNPDHHYHLQRFAPRCKVTKTWFHKIVDWYNLWLPDGKEGYFRSYWFFGNGLHWYKGNVKCDGSRTRAYWLGQLDDGQGEPYIPDPEMYVMTTTEKEKLSVRFFVDPGEPTWDNMGGS